MRVMSSWFPMVQWWPSIMMVTAPLLSLPRPDMDCGVRRGPGHTASGVWSRHLDTDMGWMGQNFVLWNFQNLPPHIDFIWAPIFNETSEYSMCLMFLSESIFQSSNIYSQTGIEWLLGNGHVNPSKWKCKSVLQITEGGEDNLVVKVVSNNRVLTQYTTIFVHSSCQKLKL